MNKVNCKAIGMGGIDMEIALECVISPDDNVGNWNKFLLSLANDQYSNCGITEIISYEFKVMNMNDYCMKAYICVCAFDLVYTSKLNKFDVDITKCANCECREWSISDYNSIKYFVDMKLLSIYDLKDSLRYRCNE